MSKSSSTAILLIISILSIHLVQPQCILGRRSKDKEFPDLSKIVKGYTATVLVSDWIIRKTILVTEYYDIENGNGRVDVMEEGQTKQFLYFNNTMEAFIVEGLRCETKPLGEFIIPFGGKMVTDWTYKDGGRIVLGPSAMLWNALHQYKNGKVNYVGEDQDKSARGIRTEYWKGCLDNDRLVVKYYFPVKGWKNEYGGDLVTVPLKIVVEGETASEENPYVEQMYEFSQFSPSISRRALAIPVGIGCRRLAKNLPVAPSFEGSDISYAAELQYSEREDNYAYITNMHYVRDDLSGHSGYYFSTWSKGGKKNEVRSANDYRFIVYQESTGYVYNITMEKQSCIVSRVDQFDDGLPLPGGINVNIRHSVIIGDINKMVYMGESRRRGIPTKAFEESSYLFGDETTEDYISAVATRFYVSESGEYETGFHDKDTPVQTLMRIVDTKSQAIAEVIINIFGFTARLRGKNELLNVESCSASSKSKVIHLMFEIPDEDITRSVLSMIPTIEEQVLGLLYDYAELSPLRIPNVLVDFDVKGIHAFASILERPDFLLDFNYTGNYALEEPDDTNGLYTKRQCAKECLESFGICRAFSLCGATCYLATSRPSSERTKEDKNCHFYKRLIKEDDPGDSVPTTDYAINKLLAALFEKEEIGGDLNQIPSIVLNWKDDKGETQDKDIYLTELEVLTEHVMDIVNKRLSDFDKHFDEYRYGAKLRKSAAHVKDHGGLSYETCQMLCLNDPDCRSFSTCMPIPECLISYKYADELKKTDFVGNSRCLVVTRQYVDAFVEYSGLIRVTHSARKIDAPDQESCAKACLRADDLPCRSFDFCPRSKNKPDRCLLHSVHYADLTNKTAEMEVDSSGLCGHYSRNYVRDFKKFQGKTVPSGGNSKHVKITGATVEECAKNCVQNGGFTCNSFDHCDGSEPYRSSCFLNSKVWKEEDLVGSPVCNNYLREYYEKGKETSTKVTEKRFSKGTAAGLGIFFFLVGCGLGLVLILTYGLIVRKRS